MTETTRDDGVWYREDAQGQEVVIPKVRKVITRIGDDAGRQGPFRLTASTLNVETVDQEVPVNRPGRLIVVDGHYPYWRTGDLGNVGFPVVTNEDGANPPERYNQGGFELTYAQVEKSTERLVDHAFIDRRIKGLGAWSLVTGKRGSTELYQNVTVADAIRHVLNAIDAPVGHIDETPQAILRWFWLSDQDDAARVLIGLAEIGGVGARLDDYDGAVNFHVAATGNRLGFYGADSGEFGPPSSIEAVDGFDLRTPTRRTNYQAGLERKRDGSWIVQPNISLSITDAESQANRQDYLLERLDTYEDGGQWYLRATIASQVSNTVFTASTADGTRGIRVIVGATPLTGEADLYGGTVIGGAIGGTTTTAFQFVENVERDVQNTGIYRRTVTEAEATRVVGHFVRVRGGSAAQVAQRFQYIRAPAESQRLTFHRFERHDEDSRYFNTIRVGTVTRVLQAVSDVWTSPEDVVMAAQARLTIRLAAQRDTPFTGLLTPVVTTDYTVSAGSVVSMELDKTSGVEANLTITAGASGATIQNLKVRGQLLLPGIESAYINQDVDAFNQDGEIAWESGGIIPTDVNTAYLDSWASAMLERGLQRGWTCTLHCLASPSDSDAQRREQWETLLRLRPGRLIHVLHSRGVWEGVVRQIERTAGASVDHVDRYKIICELTNLEEVHTNVIRIGLSVYGNDQVLG